MVSCVVVDTVCGNDEVDTSACDVDIIGFTETVKCTLGLSDNCDINHIVIKIHYCDLDIIDRLSR